MLILLSWAAECVEFRANSTHLFFCPSQFLGSFSLIKTPTKIFIIREEDHGTDKSKSYTWGEKISKLLVKFSIPCILSLLISALYNIVDQIFVGNSELGYLGNAATGIVFPHSYHCTGFRLVYR